MTGLLAQCPCSGSGGGRDISPFLVLAIVVGTFALVRWFRAIWKQEGVSLVNRAMKIGIVVVLVTVVGVILAVKANQEEPTGAAATDGRGDQAATQQSQPLPRLVDLGADKCIPCKMMAPILEELKSEYAGRLRVEFYDVWKNPGVGKEYGVQIIPTQIFYDAGGKELWRHEGFLAKEDILAKWAELGVALSAETTE